MRFLSFGTCPPRPQLFSSRLQPKIFPSGGFQETEPHLFHRPSLRGTQLQAQGCRGPSQGPCGPPLQTDTAPVPAQDHSEHPIGAAATMAHEIGHNFGMSHDSQDCCVEATPEQGGCVMAAATG